MDSIPPAANAQTGDWDIRKEIIQTTKNVLIDAGAGTGKTTLLLERILFLIENQKIPLTKMVIITFTDQAANELKERLRTVIYNKFQKASSTNRDFFWNAFESLEKSKVSTIHSFCSSILKEFPIESGVDPQFRILEEFQKKHFESQCWEQWIQNWQMKSPDVFFNATQLGISTADIYRLKENMKNQQYSSLFINQKLPDGTELRKKMGEKLHEFWNTEIRCHQKDDRLYQDLIQLRKEFSEFENNSSFFSKSNTIFFNEQGELKSFQKRGNQSNWDSVEQLNKIRDTFDAIGQSMNRYVQEFEDVVLKNLENELLAYVQYYQFQKIKHGFLDYDDLILKTRDLLQSYPEIRQELKHRFDKIFVDEFQDTDPIQMEICFFLSEKNGAHEKELKHIQLQEDKLFLVGDPKQSIYRFRKADIELYQSIRKYFLSNDSTEVKILSSNFRTVPKLIEWINSKFLNLIPEYISLQSNQCRTSDQYIPEVKIIQVEIESKNADDQREKMAFQIAQWIREELLSHQFKIQDPETKMERWIQEKDIAILFDKLEPQENFFQFAFEKYHIAYQIIGGKRFYSQPEVVTFQTLLECLSEPSNESKSVAVLRSSIFGFSDQELYEIHQSGQPFNFLLEIPTGKLPKALHEKLCQTFNMLKNWYERIPTFSTSEAVVWILEQTNLIALSFVRSRTEQIILNLKKLVHLSKKLETSEKLTFAEFSNWLGNQIKNKQFDEQVQNPDLNENLIKLMTIHKSKGLEFPVVIVVGSEESISDQFLWNAQQMRLEYKLKSHKTAGFEALLQREEKYSIDEQMRLLYVACTRARDALIIFTPQNSDKNFSYPLMKLLNETERTSLKIDNKKHEETKRIQSIAIASQQNGYQFPQNSNEGNLLKEINFQKETWLQLVKTKLIHSTINHPHQTEPVQSHQDDQSQRNPNSFEVSPEQLGIFVHAMLKKYLDNTLNFSKKDFEKWGKVYSFKKSVIDECFTWIQLALTSKVIQRARDSKKTFTELPITFFNAALQHWDTGIIDLAFLENEKWILLDYKTDKTKQFLDSYKLQIEFYSELLNKSTPYPVFQKYIYFLRLKDLEEIV